MNDVSVKERLKNKRKETGKNFDELLVYIASSIVSQWLFRMFC